MAWSATLDCGPSQELMASRRALIELAQGLQGQEEHCCRSPLELFWLAAMPDPLPDTEEKLARGIYMKTGLWSPLEIWLMELCWSGDEARMKHLIRGPLKDYALSSKLILREARRMGDGWRFLSRANRSEEMLKGLHAEGGEIDVWMERRMTW